MWNFETLGLAVLSPQRGREPAGGYRLCFVLVIFMIGVEDSMNLGLRCSER